MDLLGTGIFVILVVGILFSYRLFMSGDTPKERVAKLLPSGFKADMAHRKGDTYIGYESRNDRLVLIDWPHATVVSPVDIRALEPVSERMLGVTHYWLAVDAPDNRSFSRFRIWFQFQRVPRDLWYERVAQLRKNANLRAA